MHTSTRIAALALAFAPMFASSEECTANQAFAAESVTDYLTSWENVHTFYKQFSHCYDGAIAEGVEDKVQLLWANHWDELPKMMHLVNNDLGFKAFVWRIIDSEAFPQDTFAKVLSHARHHCPPVAVEFCAAIKKSASQIHP